MLGVGLAALVTERCGRVGEVQEDALDARAVDREQLALRARVGHRLEDAGLHLEVPRVVDVAGLEDRASRRRSVAATLERDGLEVRLVRVAELVVHRVGDDVTRLEVDDLVGTGADRLEVAGRVLELLALVGLELLLLKDVAARADAPLVDVGVRGRVGHDDGVRVLRDDRLHTLGGVRSGDCRLRVGHEGEREGDVVGGERSSVRPLHALTQLPGDGQQVSGNPAVRDRRDL